MAPESPKSWLEIHVDPSMSPDASTSHLDSMLRTRVPARVEFETQYGVSLPKVTRRNQHVVFCADPRLAQVACAIIDNAGYTVSRIVELPEGREVVLPTVGQLDLRTSNHNS